MRSYAPWITHSGKQMEAAQRGHEENVEQLAQEKQVEIEEAHARVSRFISSADCFSSFFFVILFNTLFVYGQEEPVF